MAACLSINLAYAGAPLSLHIIVILLTNLRGVMYWWRSPWGTNCSKLSLLSRWIMRVSRRLDTLWIDRMRRNRSPYRKRFEASNSKYCLVQGFPRALWFLRLKSRSRRWYICNTVEPGLKLFTNQTSYSFSHHFCCISYYTRCNMPGAFLRVSNFEMFR